MLLNSDYTITLDGQEVRTHGVMCVIANQSAGLMHLEPRVDGADGLLDVAVFRDESLSTVAKAAGNVLLRDENLVPAAHWQGREVTGVSQPAEAIQADGEVLPAGSVTVRIVPPPPCALWCPATMPDNWTYAVTGLESRV